MAEDSFTVVVCTRNRPEELAACLKSLLALTPAADEIVVVDNSDGHPAVRRSARDAGARYVIEPRVGLSRARNAGARAATSDIVAFIDDDATAEPGWLGVHAAALQDPGLSATTGRVLDSVEDGVTGVADLGADPVLVNRQTPGWFERANFGGVGVGGNMAFRRSLFADGLAFRESLGLGPGTRINHHEEHYAFFTLVRSGHTIRYLPEAIVRHPPLADAAAWQRWRRRMLRGSAAYVLLLAREEPEFRGDLIRLGVSAARGQRREWRQNGSLGAYSRVDLLRAGVSGAALFLRGQG